MIKDSVISLLGSRDGEFCVQHIRAPWLLEIQGQDYRGFGENYFQRHEGFLWTVPGTAISSQ